MPIEIERKFLVINDQWRGRADGGQRLRQGYLAREEHASVRVRLSGDRAWLTVKSAKAGIMRDEFEYEISCADAEHMLSVLCKGPVIEKIRYRVPHAGKIWEVDVFTGSAEGLILAEVELNAADEGLEIPDWAGLEVTDDPRFRNSAIAIIPPLSIPA